MPYCKNLRSIYIHNVSIKISIFALIKMKSFAFVADSVLQYKVKTWCYNDTGIVM